MIVRSLPAALLTAALLAAGPAAAQSGSLAPLADTAGYAPAPYRTATDHVFCVAAAPGAVYVSDAFAAPPGRTIALVRSEWDSFMRRKDPKADFTACSHDLADKAAAYRQRDSSAAAQLRTRGLLRVTYTGWIG